MTGKPDYEVGYGRPPKATRFRKGVSGNPSGRSKKPNSMSALINAALSEKVVVNQNGQRRSISKLEAAFTQMANKAASGDRQATKLMVEILHHAEVRDEARMASTVGPDARRASDAAILAAIKASARQVLLEDSDDSSG